MPEPKTDPEEKHDVRVIVSSLGNERRNVLFKDQNTEEAQKIVGIVSAAFGTIRTNEALLLTGSDGQILFAHLSNVVFVEVQVD